MSQRFCHYVNPAGVFCGGPPVNQRDYCFWHMHETGRRMKAARTRARSEAVVIHLPVLDDLHAVQVGLMQLAEAIAHREIDAESGRLLLAVLRLAASNLKSDRGWSQRAQIDTFGMDANIVTEEPAFERQYGFPSGFDVSRDPEQVFPPPPHVAVEIAGTEEQGRPDRNRPQQRDHRRRDAKRNRAATQPHPTTLPPSGKSPAASARPAAPSRKPPRRSDTRPDGTSHGHKKAATGGM